MVYLIVFLLMYIAAGFGFALSAYLQMAEDVVEGGGDIPRFFDSTCLKFVFFWWIIAIYCYRTEVSRTLKKIDVDQV